MSAPLLFLVYIKFSGVPCKIALNPTKVFLMGSKIIHRGENLCLSALRCSALVLRHNACLAGAVDDVRREKQSQKGLKQEFSLHSLPKGSFQMISDKRMQCLN